MKYPIKRLGSVSDPDLNGRSFVGVSRIGDSDRISIVVPYGIDDIVLPDEIGEKDKEFDFLRHYVKAVHKALTDTMEREEIRSGLHNPTAAVNILHDYLSHGKYIEYDPSSELSDRGKIDFNQTIKKILPTILENEFYYDQFITRKKIVSTDNLVAAVQCKVINHFMQHGGVLLFGQSITAPRSDIKLNHTTVTRLRKELSNTFNSRKENIIRWCIEYIDGLRNLNEKDHFGGKWNYAVIAYSFWETMVTSVLGDRRPRKKSQYGKVYSFKNFDGTIRQVGNPTEHDTIYEDDDKLIIIDAKMYGRVENLLSEENLGKQFGYYEEAKRKKKAAGEDKTIVNIMLLPKLGEDTRGFQPYFIDDPHTPATADPYKIIFIYEFPANELIEAYYKGINLNAAFIDEFSSFVSTPTVEAYLARRGCVYKF